MEIKLDKTKVYDLSELTSEEMKELLNWLKKNDENWEETELEDFTNGLGDITLKFYNNEWNWSKENATHNAKELFYTLENVQVDCSELSEEQIKEMANVFENAGYKYFSCKEEALRIDENVRYNYLQIDDDKEIIVNNVDNNKTTITYDKFMELFASTTTDSIQPHYDNTKGSIYKFCNDQKLNSWEFDIIKRVVRCRKKGLFKEDLQKTKDLINLYLKEFEDETKS